MTAPRLGAAPRAWAMLALVALIGLNLRPFLTGPGTVLAGIEADTGLGHLGASMLTVLPMLLMGVGAFLAPWTVPADRDVADGGLDGRRVAQQAGRVQGI
ncbi:hypothetical protein WLV55_24830, partial [Bordetella bronchiseptica]